MQSPQAFDVPTNLAHGTHNIIGNSMNIHRELKFFALSLDTHQVPNSVVSLDGRWH